MFKKIYERFDNLKEYIRTQTGFLDSMCNDIHYDVRWIKTKTNEMPEVTRMEKTIESQQQTIEVLTKVLQDKYENGLFVYSQDGKMPIVIRNGQVLTHKFVRAVDISWDCESYPEINISEING